MFSRLGKNRAGSEKTEDGLHDDGMEVDQPTSSHTDVPPQKRMRFQDDQQEEVRGAGSFDQLKPIKVEPKTKVSFEQVFNLSLQQLNEGKYKDGILLKCEGKIDTEPRERGKDSFIMTISDKTLDGKKYEALVGFTTNGPLSFKKGDLVSVTARLNNAHPPILRVEGPIQITGSTDDER